MLFVFAILGPGRSRGVASVLFLEGSPERSAHGGVFVSRACLWVVRFQLPCRRDGTRLCHNHARKDEDNELQDGQRLSVC